MATDVNDTEMQQALTAICTIVDEQATEGFQLVALVFASTDGTQYRCFRTDQVADMSDLFRRLADTVWSEEHPPQDWGGNRCHSSCRSPAQLFIAHTRTAQWIAMPLSGSAAELHPL